MMENDGKSGVVKISHEGNPKAVFLDIRKFRDKRVEGVETETGPLLMVLSGSQRGVYGGGGVSALEDLEMRFGFKTAVGVSTGTPTILYFLSGQSHIGTSIYFEENISKEMIDIRRGAEGKSIIDITRLMNVFKTGKKAFDQKKFDTNPTKVMIAVTDSISGEGYLLDGKKSPDLVSLAGGSCAVPELYVDEIKLDINGESRKVVDGAVAFPFPVKKTLAELGDKKPTSILVFANRPRKFSDTFMDRILKRYFAAILNPDGTRTGIEKDIMTQNEMFEENLRALQESGIPYTIVWTDNNAKSMERRPEILKQAAKDFSDYVRKIAS